MANGTFGACEITYDRVEEDRGCSCWGQLNPAFFGVRSEMSIGLFGPAFRVDGLSLPAFIDGCIAMGWLLVFLIITRPDWLHRRNAQVSARRLLHCPRLLLQVLHEERMYLKWCCIMWLVGTVMLGMGSVQFGNTLCVSVNLALKDKFMLWSVLFLCNPFPVSIYIFLPCELHLLHTPVYRYFLMRTTDRMLSLTGRYLESHGWPPHSWGSPSCSLSSGALLRHRRSLQGQPWPIFPSTRRPPAPHSL